MGLIKWQKGFDPNKTEAENEAEDTPNPDSPFGNIDKAVGTSISDEAARDVARVFTQIYHDWGDSEFTKLVLSAIISLVEVRRKQVVQLLISAEGITTKEAKENMKELKRNYNKFVKAIQETFMERTNKLLI